MAKEYSVEVCTTLAQRFESLSLHRPMRITHYDAGSQLSYDVEAVAPGAPRATVDVTIEKFVGGGFAGQVYRVRIDRITGGSVPGLETGNVYALKILIPPSSFSLLFRNLLYWVGFQGPFQLQSNPAAARAGALWQKFIRRAAGITFGDESVVNNVHATFVDSTLGSCGEISDWVDGRTWRLEVDDRMDLLARWERGKRIDPAQLGSPEYRGKKEFMTSFVRMLNQIGAHEFARQYEWSTWKSQPNCLKRTEADDNPQTGLIAVDFRAGLALLPFLPMSPGDVMLILKGIARGSLVQFDRGNLHKLEEFVNAHAGRFEDIRELIDELKEAEAIYRNSIPDITHNHVRLLYSPRLWGTMLSSAVTGGRVKGTIDETHERQLHSNRFSALLFTLIGLIPFLGKVVQKAWAHGAWKSHYRSMIGSFGYLRRALRGRMLETLINWHRDGRISEQRAIKLAVSPAVYLLNMPLSVLPPGIHRFLTDGNVARQWFHDVAIRPIKLYFDAELREQWLYDMVAEGRRKHIISEDDAERIVARIKEPFIQKYLKSLAVHVCTAPVTQVVSILIAVIYVLTHPEMPRAQAWGIGVGIIALFQVIPLSPGSLTRGLYVLYLVIRERNFKDYNIAVFLGFFKYVGYLAFPIQMTYRYPVLARFMAGYWATEAVHIVPVFGESGALLERKVFTLFYNWPLTIQRRMKARAQLRKKLSPRYWHVGLWTAVGAAVLVSAEQLYLHQTGQVPTIRDIWYVALALAPLGGAAVTLGCGGASLGRRIIATVLWGVSTAMVFTAVSTYMNSVEMQTALAQAVWRTFMLTIFSTIGALATEIILPEPALARRSIRGPVATGRPREALEE